MMKTILKGSQITDTLLARLDERAVALWISGAITRETLALVELPWQLVLCDEVAPDVRQQLANLPEPSDPIVRKRGYPFLVEADPSRIDLPQRCLPIYVLGSRDKRSFEDRLKRMAMMDQLRRSGAKQVLIISPEPTLPSELPELWDSGFRSFITFASPHGEAEAALTSWLDRTNANVVASLVHIDGTQFPLELRRKYEQRYADTRDVIRIRNHRGNVSPVDLTGIDDPDRPLLEYYELLRERDLLPLTEDDLKEEEFRAFFSNPADSWRPYAAGVPWLRSGEPRKALFSLLRRLDEGGSDENCIAYISAEPGAGGTTLSRLLALESSRAGYPALVAKPFPFTADAKSLVNFLTAANLLSQKSSQVDSASDSRLYQTPWIVVFDVLHWQNREEELTHLRHELVRSGRVACILVVTGAVKPLSFYNTSVFKQVATLGHLIEEADAEALGHHLNRFLRTYNMARSTTEWHRFYQSHTVRYVEGLAAFWVSLSFWIQGHYDLNESLQQWIYRRFKEGVSDPAIQQALLEIAALSTERVPLPEDLLPKVATKWPLSHLLEDIRSDLTSIGLIRISTDGRRYWALIHDLLGRWLINAFFHDPQKRREFGLGEAKDAEHLRFLLLRNIASRPELGERSHRELAEEFATTFFKIDPDHGMASFAPIWREALNALDAMPRTVLDGSRVFRHHIAISRRRIAKLDENLYMVSSKDRRQLLLRAVEDLKYALQSIERRPNDEPDLLLYNSLANAYFDLADVEAVDGAGRDRILELRRLAAEATRLAYAENPNNPFTVETYVKNLIQDAKTTPEVAVERCVEALGVVFSALSSDHVVYRKAQLGSLGDSALSVLLQQAAQAGTDAVPKNAIDVLVRAWTILAKGGQGGVFTGFESLASDTRYAALHVLESNVAKGNLQVLRLRFDLVCAEQPFAYQQQVELLDELSGESVGMPPQLKLEYAATLFQVGRYKEGDERFRELRQLWRASEQFVFVPERLRWLRESSSGMRRIVSAVIGSEQNGRPMARVPPLGNVLVPFRSEEHGLSNSRPGKQFTCTVSFGHNGPFLRPTTAPE